MDGEVPTIATLVVASVIAYVLGSLPTAYVAGRLKGVNIFQVGSGQAGATNVFREVSRRLGIAVFFVDSTKGLLAVLSARWLGLDGGWLMFPAAAVILGHWNSPLTRFKGGDGVSSLTGVGLGLAPSALALPYLLIAFITLAFNSRLAHPTLWGAVAGYLLFLGLAFSPATNVDPLIVAAMTGLGVAILVHSLVYHRRERVLFRPEEVAPPESESDSPLTHSR